jgi:plastocyanin
LNNRSIVTFVLASGAFLVLLLSTNLIDVSGASTAEVNIPKGSSKEGGNHFEPEILKIGKGTTVKWTNEDDTLHTVTSGTPESGSSGTQFDSSYLSGGKTYEHTFKKTGTFNYYCTLHPYMTGKIYVSKSSPPPIETAVPKSKTSYQLIIYLDNASPQNAIGDNFKILVYNSDNEPILSAKPNIDFNDDHQKISPPNGYPIIYQSGQYPKDIRVCAQQEYQLNGTTYLHNDCYPIIQNVQKTYWYTTFDYAEIDGFEPNSNLTAKSNEKTPATATITPDNKSSFLNSSDIANASSTGNSTFLNESSITILSHNSYVDSDSGYLHVVGEVENNSPSTAAFVQITGTFYDSNNQVVGTEFTFTHPSHVASGQKAPFDLTLSSASILYLK